MIARNFTLLNTLFLIVTLGGLCCGYVLLTVDGQVWVERALIIGARTGIAVNIGGLLISVLRRSKPQLIVSLFFLALMGLGFISGAVECLVGGLSGGYDRISNCGYGSPILFGFLNFVTIVGMQGRQVTTIALMTFALTPIGFMTGHYYFSNILHRQLAAIDLESDCVLSVHGFHAYPWRADGVTRLLAQEHLQLGYLIGEKSPRIYWHSKEGGFIWKYARRSFVSYQISNAEELCSQTANGTG